MNGAVSTSVLLLFGAALMKLGLSTELLLYVRPSARPWVLAAGVCLILLAAWSVIGQLRGAPEADEPDGHEDEPDGHGHGGSSKAAWLVLAPVIAVLVIAPPALGEFTANRAPAITPSAAGSAVSLRPGNTPLELKMLTFLTLAAVKPEVVTNRPITLVGFVQHDRPGGFTLARLVITCCAADASTGSVTVDSSQPVPAVGSWVRVTGTFTGVGNDPAKTPVLNGTAVTPVRTPANPYD